MPLTASTMAELGIRVPPFSLVDVCTNRIVQVPEQLIDQPLLVMFICRHCPFVIHIREELARIGRDYCARLAIIAISSNDVSYDEDDSPRQLAEMAGQLAFTFPFCYDETQAVAKAFGAACTPDFFLFTSDHRLAYRGQLDGSRPSNDLPTDGRHLRDAMDSLLAGSHPEPNQIPSVGCNIKWKPGNEPRYYYQALVKQ